jgi:hypothetical protein
MAVAPVFIANVATLQAQLRLGELLVRDAGYAVLEQAMRSARVVLYDALGSGTVNSILAYASVENPTTANQITRTKTEALERDLVLVYLVHHLPVAFMGASGAMPQWYEKEAPFRLRAPDDRERLKQEVEERINRSLQDITLQFSGVQGSCEVTTGSAPCAHTLSALPDDCQAPLLDGVLDARYLNVDRSSLRGMPGLLRW